MASTAPSIAAFLTHPVQYYSPWFAELSHHARLKVFYALKDTASDQAQAGFGVAFDWDVDLMSGYESAHLDNVAVPPRLAGFNGCDVPGVADVLDRERPDAVLVFGWHKKYYWQVLLAARRFGIPAFVRVDSQLPSPRSAIKRWLKYLPYRLVLPRLAHYLSPGERATAYLRHYGVPARRIHRVPHMVDVDRFRSASAASDVCATRASLSTEDNQVALLFVGKLIDKKQPVAIVEAVARLPADERDRFVIWYVGSGELSERIAATAMERGVAVRMPGFRNQSALPAIYAAADCLVLPSDAGETWGLVVNEAFACGTPALVSSAVGAGPDLIEEEVTGWRFAFNDIDALAQRLQGLDRQKLQAMSDAVREKAATFSYPTGSAALIDAIDRVKRDGL